MILSFGSLLCFSSNDFARPVHEALIKWQEVPYYVSTSIDYSAVVQVDLNCNVSLLMPTHADQTTKFYHQFESTEFNIAKLKYNDEACLLPSKYKNSLGQFYCQRADTFYTAIISDTYRDRCGNNYRAFWRVSYLKQHDNMGTLFSKGRTLYPKPNSQFAGDVQLGGTYVVDKSDFLFLSPLFSADLKNIERAFKDNQNNILRFNEQTLLFEER